METRKAGDPLKAETVGIEVSIYHPRGDGESGTISRERISLSDIVDMIDDYRTRRQGIPDQEITALLKSTQPG